VKRQRMAAWGLALGLALATVGTSPAEAQTCILCSQCPNPELLRTSETSGQYSIVWLIAHCEVAYQCEQAIPCFGEEEEQQQQAATEQLSALLEDEDTAALTEFVESQQGRFEILQERGVLLTKRSCDGTYVDLRALRPDQVDALAGALGVRAAFDGADQQ